MKPETKMLGKRTTNYRELGIIDVRITEDIRAHVWPGGRVMVQGHEFYPEDLARLMRTILQQRRKSGKLPQPEV